MALNKQIRDDNLSSSDFDASTPKRLPIQKSLEAGIEQENDEAKNWDKTDQRYKQNFN